MDLPVNQIICGDALGVLKTLHGESINCCLKSNDDLKVMLNSTATEVTQVMFNNTHLGQKATT